MNGGFDPLGGVVVVVLLAVVGSAVLKLFRRPRRNIGDWLLLVIGVVLALGAYVGGWFLYAFLRLSLEF